MLGNKKNSVRLRWQCLRGVCMLAPEPPRYPQQVTDV